MGANSNELKEKDSISKKKNRCRICGSNSLTSYLNLGEMPLPNNLFKTQEEAKDYYIKELKSKLGGRGPNSHPGPNENGFYVDTNVKFVLSSTELYNKRNDWLKNQKRPYRLRPCYEDVNDKSTIQWWLIHY